jgi:hypothetical protein
MSQRIVSRGVCEASWILGVVALFPVTALAAGWQTTFDARAVSTYLKGTDLKVMVAGVGSKEGPAVAALTRTLRDTSGVKLAMPADALGSLDGLEDAAIVKRAQKMPIDRILVVRVFPNREGGDSAVVSVYDRSGMVLSAFTGVSGEPMAQEAPATSHGVSSETARAVDSLTRVSDGDAKAREEFEKRAVFTGDMMAVNMNTGMVVSSWTNFYKGKYREPLDGAAFLDYVGKPELATQYRKVESDKTWLRLGYWSALVVGETVFWWGFAKWAGASGAAYAYDDYNSYEAQTAVDDKRASGKTMMLLGSLLHAGWIVGMIVDGSIDYPVTTSQALEYAEEYNKKLAGELGVSNVGEPPVAKTSATKSGPTFTVAPFFTPNGGGLGLALRF